jgi:DNA repair photolyase
VFIYTVRFSGVSAASYVKRIKALKYLSDNGCKTWVSIEPYPTPNLIEQDLMPILEAIDFADKIIFGRTNYNTDVTSFHRHREFYHEQAEAVVGFCNGRGIDYHIKDGTMLNTD